MLILDPTISRRQVYDILNCIIICIQTIKKPNKQTKEQKKKQKKTKLPEIQQPALLNGTDKNTAYLTQSI